MTRFQEFSRIYLCLITTVLNLLTPSSIKLLEKEEPPCSMLHATLWELLLRVQQRNGRQRARVRATQALHSPVFPHFQQKITDFSGFSAPIIISFSYHKQPQGTTLSSQLDTRIVFMKTCSSGCFVL